MAHLTVPVHAARFQYGTRVKRWSKYHFVRGVDYGRIFFTCNINHLTFDLNGDLVAPEESPLIERAYVEDIAPDDLCQKCLGAMGIEQ